MATLIAESNLFRVGPAYVLAFRPAPVALSGEPFALQVEVLKAGELSEAEIEITLAYGGPGALAGDLVVQSVAGVATFNLTADVAGLYDFQVTAEEAEMAILESVEVGPGMVPIVAFMEENSTLRVFFSLPLDEGHAPNFDPQNYSITGVSVTSVALAGLRSVLLTLGSAPDPGTYQLDLAAGTILSTTGAAIPGTTLEFTVVDSDEPSGPADQIPPTAVDFDPIPGTPIAKSQEISFTVTDNTSLRQVLIAVRYSIFGGRTELVHDGEQFCSAYRGTRTPVEGGFRFTVSRYGGWPDAPTIQVFAVDTSGNTIV